MEKCLEGLVKLVMTSYRLGEMSGGLGEVMTRAGGSHWDNFHLVRFVIRQPWQPRSIFPGKVQSDVTGITEPQGG